MEFSHKPIMVSECIEGLQIKPEGIYIDGTVGGGGHSSKIAALLNEKGLLVGLDRDQEAIKASKQKLMNFKKNVKLIHTNFSNIKEVVQEDLNELVDGILLDLGVSSYQLDNAERGFTYQVDAQLDMRMDKTQKLSAEDVVNNYNKEELLKIITAYGEERWAKRIVDFIIQFREDKRIKTTGELVEIIKKAIPVGARREGPHPAKRTFQAIRIEVNNELNIIKQTIEDAVGCLKCGGRICIITFHSLEDRIVKQTFSSLQGKCTCPIDFPVCKCENKTFGKVVNRKPIQPTEDEINNNPRARSAKLRIFEKC